MLGDFENVVGSLIRGHVFAKPLRLSDVPSWQGHIPFAYFLTGLLRPRTIVELGTHKGDSYGAFCQTVQTLGLETRCFAVDTWQGDDHAGQYDNVIFDDVYKFNSDHFSPFSTLIRARFDEAVDRFEDGSIDLLHIDGLHTYEAVKTDFETWQPKLSNRAIVLFHDTQVQERDFGVWRLWQELCEKYPAQEFRHSNGLGVLGYGALLDEPVKHFLSVGAPEWDSIQLFFERLGTACSATGTTFQLKGDLERANNERNHLNNVIQEQAYAADKEQDHLKSVVSAERQRSEFYEKQCSALNAEIAGIKQSTSWQITRPLRALARTVRGK